MILPLLVLLAQVPVEVAQSATFSEGPVFDREGNLFFSHREGISKFTPKGETTVWVRNTEANFNGHKILPDGTHLVCASKPAAVLRFDPEGRALSPASNECDGKPLRAPNDITLDGRGGFYFTDPGGSRTSSIGTVHYVDPAGKTHLVAGGLWVPNGLVFSPDRKILYVAETVPNRILKFRALENGKLGPIEWFADLPAREGHQAEPDGMAVDSNGRVYVAHLGTGTVKVLSKDGRLVETLEAGVYDASNLAFGGPKMDQLFVTGATGHRSKTPGRVFRLTLPGVRGL